MTWILEEPLYIVILGAITLAFIGFAWMQTGSRTLLHAAIGVAALTAGLLLLERLVETEPEQIESTLRQIGRDVERNDHEKIYSYVYSGAPATLALAQREFPRYAFTRVVIKRNVEITLSMDSQPPLADVTFNVRVDLKEVATGQEWRIPRFVHVTMRKEDGRWKVDTYSHDEPQAGMRMRDDR
jgi:hypothetical protein